jgi:hypothetical protein
MDKVQWKLLDLSSMLKSDPIRQCPHHHLN